MVYGIGQSYGGGLRDAMVIRITDSEREYVKDLEAEG